MVRTGGSSYTELKSGILEESNKITMATTYSTLLYHNITPRFNNDRNFVHNIKGYFRDNNNRRTADEEERTLGFYKNNTNKNSYRSSGSSGGSSSITRSGGSTDVKALNTARIRKASSVLHNIIVESVYENMSEPEEHITKAATTTTTTTTNDIHYLENNIRNETENMNDKHGNETNNNNNNIYTNSDRQRSNKKLYKHRKHHSDYDIVYLQVDNDEDNEDNITTTHQNGLASSYSDLDNSGETSDADNVDGVDIHTVKRPYSKSESNLSNFSMGKIKKSSSQIDITSTQMYKDIYADNLRQYGFLLAKQLGISKHSPDQLRKTYQKGRKKALERRERASTTLAGSREELDAIVSTQRDRSSTSASIENASEHVANRKLSSQSNLSISLSELRHENKYARSLTDISNIAMLEKHKKPATTVIRRKKGNKFTRDPTKRLSAPLMETVRLSELDEDSFRNSMQFINSNKPPIMASLSVPDLSTGLSSSPDDSGNELPENEGSRRKLSDETMKRQKEAKARQEWRMSRLKSFEGVLSQANSWMKDAKTKKQEHNTDKIEESVATNSSETSETNITQQQEGVTIESTNNNTPKQPLKQQHYIVDKSDI